MARRATRNAQQTIYRLYFGPSERNVIVRRRPFDSESWGGGAGCQILFGQIIYFRLGLGREIYFHAAWARENLFPCKHGITNVHCTEAITRNINVIESSTTKISHPLISSDSVYYY